MWLGEKQHLSIKLALLLASSFQWTYYILQRGIYAWKKGSLLR